MQGVTQIKPGRRPRRSARRHKSVSSMPLPVNPKKDMQCLERLRPKSEGRTIVEPGSRRRHYDISAYSVIGPQGNAVSSPALPASHLELRLDPQFACRVRAARFACWDLAACVRFRAALFACLARASCEAADRSSFFSARNVARERRISRLACLRVRAVVALPLGAGSLTPARLAFDKPIAIACFVERAPCLPSRMCSISSRTNSPACVDGALPCRASLRARSRVSCSGTGGLLWTAIMHKLHRIVWADYEFKHVINSLAISARWTSICDHPSA